MPAPGLTFSSGPAEIRLDRSGRVVSVQHQARPGLGYLSGLDLGTLQVDGQTRRSEGPEVQADLDEVEFLHSYGGGLRLVVRHSFAAGWGLRIAFSNESDQPQRVDRAELHLEPDPHGVGWALALGVTATYSVAPASGVGPLLGAVLRRGSVDRVSGTGLELTPFELRPRGRYVLQLQWGWYPTPRAFSQERGWEAPSALFVTTGEAVQVRVDEDVAVLAPSGVETTHAEDYLEVVSDQPGSYPFELRSSRGTTAFDLEWVAPLTQRLLELAAQALTRPRTSAGVVRLADVAEALVVQHALAAVQVDDPEEAAEALDLFSARLAGETTLTPLDIAYLCREHARSGDAELVTDARTALLAVGSPAPGLGMAATQLCLALIVGGRPVDEVLAHLLRLTERTREGHQESGTRSVPAQAAELELLAVTHAGPGLPGTTETRSDLVSRVSALGLHLGAGLPGRAVDRLPVAELSHLVAVFSLLPDELSGRLNRLWGCSAQALAARARPELLARLDREPVGLAHAWLVLALQSA